VAHQIQCSGKPFETFTIVASKSVLIEDVHRGLCIFAAAKNETCSGDVSMAAPPQPYNMAADNADGGGDMLSITKCLVRSAERSTGRTLFRHSNIAEYTSRIVSAGQHILSAAASRTLQFDNYSDPDDAATARSCGNTLVKGVGGFLQCALPAVTRRRRRRLLATDPTMLLEQHATSTGSYARVTYDNRNVAPPSATVIRPPAAVDGLSTGALVGICIGVAVVVLLMMTVLVFLVLRRGRRGYVLLPQKRRARM
jgi:hypothetical protein